jgi:hypothetical protein
MNQYAQKRKTPATYFVLPPQCQKGEGYRRPNTVDLKPYRYALISIALPLLFFATFT